MRSTNLLVAAAVLTLCAPRLYGDEKATADLAAVPGDAAGFLHVRVGELMQGELFKPIHELLKKAGPKALAAFDQRFVPAPSTIDRFTMIILNPGPGGAPEPPVVFVVGASKPFNAQRFVSAGVPNAQKMKAGETEYFVDPESEVAFRVLDDRHILFGPHIPVSQYLAAKPGGAGLFADAIRDAKTKSLVFAMNTSLIPGEAVAELPPPIQPLLRAKVVHAAVEFGKETKLELRAQFGDVEAAKAGEGAIQEGAALAREELKKLKKEAESKVFPKKEGEISPLQELPEAAVALLALGAIQHLDDFLKDLPVKREDTSLTASLTVPGGPFGPLMAAATIAPALLVPAVQKVRMAASRVQSSNNLKQIALAMHNYHDAYNQFPAAAICDKNGKPLLSWRVAVLPFIEQENLYRQFKLDEPWDSEHNKKLASIRIKTYEIPGLTAPDDSLCYYRVFHGKGAMFDLRKGTRIVDILDGTSNTIMIVEAADGVPWTRPDELEYDPEKPLPKLGKHYPEVFQAAFADGSVRVMSRKTSEKTLRALITRAGGEVVNNDER